MSLLLSDQIHLKVYHEISNGQSLLKDASLTQDKDHYFNRKINLRQNIVVFKFSMMSCAKALKSYNISTFLIDVTCTLRLILTSKHDRVLILTIFINFV